ncbi:MAG: hypothetical protein METHAR1v1_1060005 [Methanothrix sp.]|nr:MAG: hypothetical protein METHAR1v1_1060005 [Methanothrix sp.]
MFAASVRTDKGMGDAAGPEEIKSFINLQNYND